MSARQLTTAALVVMLVLAVAVPAATAQGTATSETDASQTITVTVETTAEETTVTLEQDGEAYAGATVHVESVGDASYAGSGSYETGTDGRLVLPTPDEEVTVRLEVDAAGATADGMVTLAAHQGVDTESTITIHAGVDGDTAATANGSAGAVEADSQGEAEVSDDGNSAASFGERISSFVTGLARVELGGIGDVVSSFAIENNPGNGDARASGDTAVEAQAGADVEPGNESARIESGNGSAAAGAVVCGDGAAVANGSIADGEASADASAEATADANADGDAGAAAEGEASVGVTVGFLG